ncbi:MAG: CHASE2 domain-containing protein, partial [Sphingomicrobium sp.]
MSKRGNQNPDRKPWRLLAWTVLAGLVFALIGLGELPEDYLRIARNTFHEHSASGDIVVITVDDQSLRQVGNWPWARRYDGEMVDKLMANGARNIFFDINFSYATNPIDDQAFANAVQRSGRVAIFVRSKQGPKRSSE